MSKYTEGELQEMYLDYLDEIGRSGIDNYGLLLKEADPIAFNIGYQDFLDQFPEQEVN